MDEINQSEIVLATPDTNGFKSKLSDIFKSKKKLIAGILAIVLISTGFYFIFKPSHNLKKLTASSVLVKSAAAVNYFSVVSVSPYNNSSDNDENTPIRITFSEPVRPDSLRSFFTVSPMIPGDFAQGSTPNEVVFKARFPFGKGTSVKVILNKGFESVAGNKFLTDYTYNFYTKILDDQVIFANNGIYSRWVSLANGDDVTFNLQVGRDVSSDTTVSMYKGTFDKIVSSLLYSNESHDNTSYLTQTFLDYSVDTSTMQKISETKNIKDSSSFHFQQGEGLYYIEAKNKNGVAGHTWVNVTDQGLLVRQDDQQVIVAAQNIKTGETNTPVHVLLYNLQGKPTLIKATDINGLGVIPVAYPQKVDLVVGQTDHGVVLVPLTIPETQADIRVTNNLSNLDKIYLTTDKPTYTSQETIKFSGVLRRDNDAKYSLPPEGSSVHVWVPDLNNSTAKLMEQTVTVGAGGVFSGEFTMTTEAIAENTSNRSFTLYAKEVSNNANYVISRSYTTFDIVQSADKAVVTVSFDKNSYTKDETVVAHIAAVDDSGNPLANQSAKYSIFAKNYYENDPSSVANFGNEWGEPTDDADKIIKLDSSGKADITLPKRKTTVSEALTVEVTVNKNGQDVSGAKTVLVQQGKVILTFAPGKQYFQPNETAISRVYATDLQGNTKSNLDLHYQLFSSRYDASANGYKENTVAEGDTKTDGNGLAVISQVLNLEPGSYNLRVRAKDDVGNMVESERSISVNEKDKYASAIYFHDLSLTNLDVVPDKLKYQIGDAANLSITSPFDQQVLLTYESGRIYHHEWLTLHKGDNTYHLDITPELAPSITIVFSYFRNQSLFIEGIPLTITDPTQSLQVTTSADKATYKQNDPAQMTITTKDTSGQAVKAQVMVSIIEDSIFGLRDNLPSGNIGWSFYSPRIVGTNFSASTLGIGTGGGCGGGSGIDVKYVPNHVGKTVYWNPNVVTDDSGQATVTVPALTTTGKLRMAVTAISADTAVAQSRSLITVQ